MVSRITNRRKGTRRAGRLARRALARAVAALSAIVGLPLYFAAGFARRRAEEIVFGGNGDRYTDNARYLFEHMAGEDRFVCTWVTGDRGVRDHVRSLGHRAELRWSRPGVIAAIRAGAFVYGAYPSDINFWLSRGALLVNLWHGIPLKAIEFDIDAGPLLRVYRARPWSPVRLAFLDRFVRPDLVVSTSPFVSERCFRTAFRVDRDRCAEVGYPRTDHLFTPVARRDLAQSLGLPPAVVEAETVVGYFPTWRDDGRDFLAEAGFSFDELDRRLGAAGRTMVFKAHPNFGDIVSADGAWTNIEVLDASADLNEVLAVCDVLVTDYSSVAFDFLLLDRPMLYFLPDHERYVRRRNLYFELDEMTAGPALRTVDELDDALTGPLLDTAMEKRHALRDRVWDGYAGGACAALADVLARTLGRDGAAGVSGAPDRAADR